ncbi:MAG: hypothetical protein AB1486_25190 [Planctomycetota bacterium]
MKSSIMLCSVLAACLFTLPAAQAQIGIGKTRKPVAPAVGRSFALVANTCNDFHMYEVSSSELWEISNGNPLFLRDRDGFPAQALQAYFVLRDTLGYEDDKITLMLFHDDDPGNSKCEIPITGGADNDNGNDEFVDVYGVPPGIGVNWLFGPNGTPGDLDDPEIDYENAAVTKDALKKAINDLGGIVTRNDEVLIYLIGHGADAVGAGANQFYFEAGEDTPDTEDDFVTAAEFDQWLDSAFCGFSAPERLVVMADCCYAAGFLSAIFSNEGCAEGHRMGVAAAAELKLARYNMDAFLVNFINPNAWPCPQFPIFSGSIFFHAFWDAISSGKGLQESFDFGWTALACWFGDRVGNIQSPVLLDGGLTQAVEFDLMQPFGPLNYYDVAWKPSSEHALLAGTHGSVAKYFWGADPLDPTSELYQTTMLRGPLWGEPSLWGVAFDEDGAEALIVGEAGTVLKFDGLNFSVVDPETGGDETDEDLYAVEYSPPGSEAELHGVQTLIVGDNGTILKYDGTNYLKLVPDGTCPWDALTADLRGVAFNPVEHFIPRPNQGAPDIFITEALITGVGGIWKYEFKFFSYLEPSLNYTCEQVTPIFQDANYEVWGVDWDPAWRDYALLSGIYTNPQNFTQWGALFLLADDDVLHSEITDLQNEWLLDISFKPNGAYAVICGRLGTILRHEAEVVGGFARYDFASTPPVPHGNTLYGIDFNPNASHALSVGVSESLTRYQERHDL